MSETMMAVFGFGAIGFLAIAMFVIERRGVAARKAARGGREVDLSGIFDSKARPGDGRKR
jgi:hypothetical protein